MRSGNAPVRVHVTDLRQTAMPVPGDDPVPVVVDTADATLVLAVRLPGPLESAQWCFRGRSTDALRPRYLNMAFAIQTRTGAGRVFPDRML